MGTTRFGLHYPELTDAPNGPAQIQQLAGDTDGLLYRAFPCTDTTRPTLTTGDRGFLADVGDLGTLERWDGSAWKVIANTTSTGSGGGGTGGGTTTIGTVGATYAASAAQAISNSTDVVVAFGVAQATDSAVTRNTSGGGHSFTLNQTRLWTVSATLRFAQNATGGRTFELRAGSTILAKASGPQNQDAPYTANLSVTRKLTSGTVITAIARHNAGTGLALEPNGGNYVHIDLGGV